MNTPPEIVTAPGTRLPSISPLSTQRKGHRSKSSSSNANASWDNRKAPPNTNTRLQNECLRVSLHSAKDALAKKSSHEQPKRVKRSSDNILKRKTSFIKDDPEVSSLLQLLQTTHFVGKIDPVHHARYIAEPEEEEPTLLFDLSEMRRPSSSRIAMMASYNSDEHLLSAMNSSKRGMELRT